MQVCNNGSGDGYAGNQRKSSSKGADTLTSLFSSRGSQTKKSTYMDLQLFDERSSPQKRGQRENIVQIFRGVAQQQL
jgi:hypothetical protein